MFMPLLAKNPNTIQRPETYVVYGWERSYFTHKLTAALNYYQAPWEFRPLTKENQNEICMRSGTHQIPVLHTPEDWMIADSTPLLHLLDARYPDRRMFPEGLAGVVVQILEEYFDEWIARTTVHWRWAYEENHELLSMDGANNEKELAQSLTAWGGKVRRALGVDSLIQQQAVEEEYHRIMRAAEEQLKKTKYLLGDRPTALDCIVLAGLRAHFLYDPVPKKALYDTYPEVVKWTENRAEQWDGTGRVVAFPDITPFGHIILDEIKRCYVSFAIGNRTALQQKKKFFVAKMYGEDVSYLARPYIEQSRQMIVKRIAALSEADRSALILWLERLGLTAAFSA